MWGECSEIDMHRHGARLSLDSVLKLKDSSKIKRIWIKFITEKVVKSDDELEASLG